MGGRTRGADQPPEGPASRLDLGDQEGVDADPSVVGVVAALGGFVGPSLGVHPFPHLGVGVVLGGVGVAFGVDAVLGEGVCLELVSGGGQCLGGGLCVAHSYSLAPNWVQRNRGRGVIFGLPTHLVGCTVYR